MATTVNRSTTECAQRVVDLQDQIDQLADAENYYRSLVSVDDPDGTLACAFNARRLRRIRDAISH
jgi:hypothetical protein